MTNKGITTAAEQPLTNPAPRTAILDQDAPSGITITKINGVPTLSKFEFKCLMVQLGYVDTKGNAQTLLGPTVSNCRGNVAANKPDNRFGKYSVSISLLEKYGYKINGKWTGLDGMDSDEVFLASPKIQDRIMQRFLEETYPKLIQVGALRDKDTKDIVAGMLAVSYQFHDTANSAGSNSSVTSSLLSTVQNNSLTDNYVAMKAKIWRDDGVGQDTLNRPGHIFYNAGKYAIQNLAADVKSN